VLGRGTLRWFFGEWNATIELVDANLPLGPDLVPPSVRHPLFTWLCPPHIRFPRDPLETLLPHPTHDSVPHTEAVPHPHMLLDSVLHTQAVPPLPARRCCGRCARWMTSPGRSTSSYASTPRFPTPPRTASG
jgi:hypothetical protein